MVCRASVLGDLELSFSLPVVEFKKKDFGKIVKYLSFMRITKIIMIAITKIQKFGWDVGILCRVLKNIGGFISRHTGNLQSEI